MAVEEKEDCVATLRTRPGNVGKIETSARKAMCTPFNIARQDILSVICTSVASTHPVETSRTLC